MRTLGLVVVDVALVLVVARVLRAALERVRQPPVMAEVLAGVVLGASVLGALPGDPSAALFTADARSVLRVLGEVAVVAYLFSVGARFDLAALRAERRAVAAVALASFAVPFGAGAALALALHGTVAGRPPLVPFVLFFGTALAVTAFPVLSRVIDARGLRGRTTARVALGAAGAQELLVWPVLGVAVALAGAGAGDGERGPLAVLGVGAASLVLVVLLARVVVPAFARRSRGGVVVLAGLAVSALATELAGLHLVVGAVLFGAALPAAAREAGLAALRARPLAVAVAVLLPLFFALPALRVELGALSGDGLAILALVLLVAVVAKFGSAALAARRSGLASREALVVGALMNTRGLVELVVLSIGLDAGLVDERLFTVLVVMALVTTFAAGPLVDLLDRTRPEPAGRVAAPPRRVRRAARSA